MGGNHSRYSHQKDKRYSALNLVQGAMVTDADQMESQTLAGRGTQHLGQRAIASGVPKTNGMLQYSHAPGIATSRLVTGLKPGHLIANGRTAELRVAPGQTLPAGTGMQLVAMQADLRNGPALPNDAARYVLLGDVWDRHAGPAEDQRFTDAAFLSAETAVRKERVAQLKFATVPSGIADAALRGLVQNHASLPNFGDLRLTAVTFGATVVEVDECDPCAGDLTETNLETGNDLFRLEVHASDFNVPRLAAANSTTFQPTALASQALTLKWSRDNGGLEIPATARDTLLSDGSFDNSVFELADLPGEQRLGLYSAGTQRVSRLLRKADLAAEPANSLTGKIIRVWDGAARIDLNAPNLAPAPVGVATLTGSIVRTGTPWRLQINVSDLELVFEAATRAATMPFVLPGDAYCVEVREFASGPNGRLIFQAEPVEVHHDYVFLGQISSGAFVNPTMPDTRPLAFPALTEITADDVSWSNRNHTTVETNTVQGAIDLLFARDTGGDDCQCTFLIDPEKDLYGQLEALQDEMKKLGLTSALICFPVGAWELSKPFEFFEHKTLILRGCGFGSKIFAKFGLSQAMLSFFDVGTVAVEDIDIENQAPDAAGCLIATDVGHVRLSRARFTIDGRDDKDQFAVMALRPKKSTGFPPFFEAEGSWFAVGSANTGIAIDGGMRLVVSNCQFAAPLNLRGKFGAGIKGRTDMIAGGKVVKATKRQVDASKGKLVTIKNLAEGMALNVEDYDEDDRRTVAEFWEKSLAIVAADGVIKDAEGFEKARNDLHVLNWGLKAAGSVALETLEVPGADTETLISGGGEFRLLRGASGFGGSDGLLSEIRMDRTPGSMALAPRLTAMANAAGPPRVGMDQPGRVFTTRPVPGTDGPPGLPPGTIPGTTPGPDDGPGLPRTTPQPELLDIFHTLEEKYLPGTFHRDWLDKFSDIEFEPVKPKAVDDAPLSFGIEAVLRYEIDTQIIRNRFSGIDIAIKLHGEGKRLNNLLTELPERTLVRDNTIVRAPRRGSRKDADRDIYPITLVDCGNPIVEHNTIQQLMDSSVDTDYLNEVLGLELQDTDLRFAAIGILGHTGNQLRAIGNGAVLYRHCVYVRAVPRAPGISGENATYPPGRPNYWVFQHNTVAPNSENDKFWNWAVRIPDQKALATEVVILRTPNHPEPPKNET